MVSLGAAVIFRQGSKMKVRQKLILWFAVIALLVGIGGVLSVNTLMKISGDIREIGDFSHSQSCCKTENEALSATAEIFAEARPVITLLFIVIGAIFFSALGIGLLISRSIINPLTELRNAAVKLGEGKLDTRIQLKAGDEIGQLAASFNKMTEDLEKTTTSIDNLNREIAEHEKTEKLLQRSEHKYRTLLENIPQNIFIKDRNSVYVSCNENFARALNIKACEIAGKTDYEFYPKELAEKYRADDRRVVESGKAENIEEKYIQDNMEMIIHTIKTPVKDEQGDIVGLLGIFSDITERKQVEQRQAELMEKVKKANRELKDFAYIASHDLKAPLRGISTLAGWISSDYADKLGEEGKEQMDMLLKRVDRMQKLIDGILLYSRVGQAEEEKVRVDLNELVSEVIDSLAPSEDIEIAVETELPVLECGQTRITQVFQNLLGNAIKYMDKPQGRIKIGCVEEERFLKFNVTDNGPGIEEKHFERIFQIFQTLSRQDENGGTGIGLTVVKKIVELYQGRIWVESQVGQGSTFFFTLPKEMRVKDAKLEANIAG